MQKIQIIDSHTGGEPTRVVVGGGPQLPLASAAELRSLLREKFDRFRSAVVNEPRGSDVLVGALLTEPSVRGCAAGVIFFNNVGYLGMCGHGSIGVMATLAHLGRIGTGVSRLETPAGVVAAELHADGSVSVENVPSYRYKKDVAVSVRDYGVVRGDIAWGGNWFFIVEEHHQKLDLKNVEALTAYTWAVRQALSAQGITGVDGAEIDHIELGSEGAGLASVNGKNFMLCPGKAYDRSPCGTGTSAKLACLAADGKLQPGARWVQAGILNSTFSAHYRAGERPGEIIPTVTGSAFITGVGELLLNPHDPFCWGIA